MLQLDSLPTRLHSGGLNYTNIMLFEVFQSRAGVEQYNPFLCLYPALIDEFLHPGEGRSSFWCCEDALRAPESLLSRGNLVIGHRHCRSLAFSNIFEDKFVSEAFWHPQSGGVCLRTVPEIAVICP